eukprot:2734529-Rhodomonas_salina.1
MSAKHPATPNCTWAVRCYIKDKTTQPEYSLDQERVVSSSISPARVKGLVRHYSAKSTVRNHIHGTNFAENAVFCS